MKNTGSPNSGMKSYSRRSYERRGSILNRLLSRLLCMAGRKDTRRGKEEEESSDFDTTVVDSCSSFFLTTDAAVLGAFDDDKKSHSEEEEEEESAPAFPFADLPPDLKKRVAGYLSTKDAYRLARTSQSTKAILGLTHRPLCPSFLIRKFGYRRQQYRFLQTIIPSTHGFNNNNNNNNPGGANKNNDSLHSVHVHCRWTWQKNWQAPAVELLVVERSGYHSGNRSVAGHITQRGRWASGGGGGGGPGFMAGEEYGNEAFRSDQVVARCAANCDRLKDDAFLAMSFQPKKKDPAEKHRHYYYELWFRCSRTFDVAYGSSSSFGGRYRQDWGPGFGEVVALEILHN